MTHEQNDSADAKATASGVSKAEILRDLIALVGFASFSSGVAVAYGVPYAAMCGGGLLMIVSAVGAWRA